MLQRRIFWGLIVIFLLVAFAGCMPNVESLNHPASPSGFFKGIWHGWIAPFSLIFGFFNDHIRIYDANNTGWWYDFGFYMAIISGFGGLSLARKKAGD